MALGPLHSSSKCDKGPSSLDGTTGTYKHTHTHFRHLRSGVLGIPTNNVLNRLYDFSVGGN